MLAEEAFVVLIVPRVGFLLGRRFVFFRRLRFGRLEILGRNLFEQRVHDLLVQQVREFQRRHRQKLDGLLQRWRQDQLLRQSGCSFCCIAISVYESLVNRGSA